MFERRSHADCMTQVAVLITWKCPRSEKRPTTRTSPPALSLPPAQMRGARGSSDHTRRALRREMPTSVTVSPHFDLPGLELRLLRQTKRQDSVLEVGVDRLRIHIGRQLKLPYE